ncbi:MAG: hypothetical protein JWN30_548 [Bacilli bacterium]|nr:hypothetical protein [Bacilli bacterium]
MNELPRNSGKLRQQLSDLQMNDLLNPFDVIKQMFIDAEKWMQSGDLEGMVAQFTDQVQVQETDEAYHIAIQLEGVERPEDIEAQFYNNQLRLSRFIEQQIKQDTDQVKLWKTYQERFERVLTLPSPVNWQARTITAQNGVWQLTIPKL